MMDKRQRSSVAVIMLTEYLRFDETQPEGRKTKVVYVYSTGNGDLLGKVQWFGRWRQYAFFPNAGTVWNPDCLDVVNERIRALMAERKANA